MIRLFINDSYQSKKLDLFYSYDDNENPNDYNCSEWNLEANINDVSTLSIKIHKSHPLFSRIGLFKTYFLLAEDDDCIFLGRVNGIQIDFNGDVDISCESYEQVWNGFIYQQPGTHNERTLTELLNEIAYNSNLHYNTSRVFNNGKITLGYMALYQDPPSAHDYDILEGKSIADILFNTIVPVVNGCFFIRIDGSVSITNSIEYVVDEIYLDYSDVVGGIPLINEDGGIYPDPIDENPERKDILDEKSFKFGLNMIDVTKEYPLSEIFTGVLTTYNFKYDSESEEVKSYVRYVGGDLLTHFGTIDRVVDTGSDSYEHALEAAKAISDIYCRKYSDKLTITGIDPHFLNPSFKRIKIGSDVNCYSEPHDINYIGTCLSFSLNSNNLANSRYVVGAYIANNNIDDKITFERRNAIGVRL